MVSGGSRLCEKSFSLPKNYFSRISQKRNSEWFVLQCATGPLASIYIYTYSYLYTYIHMHTKHAYMYKHISKRNTHTLTHDHAFTLPCIPVCMYLSETCHTYSHTQEHTHKPITVLCMHTIHPCTHQHPRHGVCVCVCSCACIHVCMCMRICLLTRQQEKGASWPK